MRTTRHLLVLAAGAAATAATLAGPASAQPRYGDQPRYEGSRYDAQSYGGGGSDEDRASGRAYGDRRDGLTGPGVPLLLRELRDTPRGRAFVLRDFDFNRDGIVQPREARAANRAFEDRRGFGRDRDDRRYGDRRDDDRRYDDQRYGERRDSDEAPPPAPPPPASDRYAGDDRPAMHAYGFRQNRYGAVFTLQDVLFETGSARLRPTADAKLRPLAGYLRRNPAQRLRIDGYTDSVGSAPANLILSRDRARSVADALATLGVDAGRFQLEGHGEDSPAASNANADGRQLNRRVEVTLLGRQASSF